ncbi:MAG: ammonium transporter [Actinobacteria bacterium]|nr:ammonium transporter [Actinomycetota bacterium]
MTRRFPLALIIVLIVLATSMSALAAEGDSPSPPGIDQSKVAMDTVWVLVTAVLVMFMQAGFALVETGFTRAKNACNILMKNLMDFSVGSIAYWAVGFGIMFAIGNQFMGTTGWFLAGADNSPASGDAYVGVYNALSWASVPLEAKYFFQLVFCATAATIVAGSMAGRTKFVSYLAYSVVISGFIYPVVGHWIWGGGWLAKLGVLDFAGSTVVHSVGGWLALTGAIVLGPRLGKYHANGRKKTSRAIPGHNIPLAALGVFILWFGWFGFNPGSTMAAVPDIAHIAATTNIAAAAGAIGAMLISWLLFGKPDASMTLNGALAGLVGITAGCAFVSLTSAIIIGFVAGLIVVLAVLFLDRVLHIDDPVGAVAVHAFCGVWGTLAVGLFAQEAFGGAGNGLFFGGGFKQLGIQALAVVSVLVWCLACGFILFYTIKALMGLRVSKEDELKGLDITEHGMEAYSGFQIFTTQ